MAHEGTPTFGTLLHRLRRAAGLTQEALAERSGLSTRGVSDLERGIRRHPYPATVQALADALDLDQESSAALAAAVTPRAAPDEGQPTGGVTGGGLPAPLTPLIGRDAEVAVIQTMLAVDGTRLLTITGPGGIGKTRVAIEVARELDDRFPEGVAFIAFAAVADPRLVVSTVAQTLGVQEASRQPVITQLRSFFGDQRILLVLDNLEHLLDSVAALVADLLAHCPGLTVLGTSRVRLALAGEQLFPLNVLDAEAAQTLFLSRARARQPGFSLTSEIAPIVSEICRRLDGLPLAIELAAARAAVLPPVALLARLERRLPLLVGGNRDAPARQRTLRNTIAWSYDLLSPDEQRRFRQLGVFAGGFTLAAASAVAGDTSDVLEGVTVLVDASLVTPVASISDAPRFSMLGTIREYALEQLAARGEEAVVRQSHATYVLGLAEQCRIGIEGPARVATLDAISSELDNVRAVLTWALEHHEASIAQHLAGLLSPVWMDRGLLREANAWLEPALRLPGATAPVRIEALYWAGFFALWHHDDGRGEQYGDEALALAHQDENAFGIASSLNLLAAVAATRQQHDLAAQRYGEALQWLRGLTEPPWAPVYVALIFDSLGSLFRRQGDLARAATYYEEALTRWRDLDHLWGIPMTLGNLAEVARRQGDVSRALLLEQESLAQHWAQGDQFHFPWNLWGIADVLILAGRVAEAARLLAAASVRFAGIGITILAEEQARFEESVVEVQTALGSHAFVAERSAGEELSLADAVAAALAVTLEETVTSQPDLVAGHGLSPREQEVLRLIGSGHSNAQIADALSISPRTVTTHASHILDKLGLSSRAEVIAFAHREHLA